MNAINEQASRTKKVLSLSWGARARWFFYLMSSSLHRGKYGLTHMYNLARLRMAGVQTGRDFSTAGALLLDVYPGSTITIGDSVTIVSDSRRSNAAALAFPAKLKTFTGTSVIHIGDRVGLNGTSIAARSRSVSIGEGTIVAPNVIITDSDFHVPWPPEERCNYPGFERDGDVMIGKNCWIGMNSIILRNVRIGDNSVIGAGSVVTSDIPANVLAAGVPAKVIRMYDKDGAALAGTEGRRGG